MKKEAPRRGEKRCIVNAASQFPSQGVMRAGPILWARFERGPNFTGQFDLEVALLVLEVDEPEVLEVHPLGDLHSQPILVEPHRTIEVADADHRVDRLSDR